MITASPGGIELAWDEVIVDTDLHSYEVRRNLVSGGPYTNLGMVVGVTSFTDTNIEQRVNYFYVVRSVDT